MQWWTRRALEGGVELLGAGDVDAAALDQGGSGPLPERVSRRDRSPGVGELLGRWSEPRASTGDDVDGVQCAPRSCGEHCSPFDQHDRPPVAKSKSSAHLCLVPPLWHTRRMSDDLPRQGRGRASRPCATSSGSAAQHLATDGAAALSLRAVARDLGVVSSAVYRYVGSRDELLTLLVVDGYDELGDAVDAALPRWTWPTRPARPRPSAGRWRGGRWPSRRRTPCSSAARCRATRRPAERTTGPGTRHRPAGRGVGGRQVAGASAAPTRPVSPRRPQRDLPRIRANGHHGARRADRPRRARVGGTVRVHRASRCSASTAGTPSRGPPGPLRAPPARCWPGPWGLG